MRLSKRLSLCAKYAEGFNNLADIGTDHALLPIQCIKEGYVQKAQAIDNKHGPYVMAFSNIKKHDLMDRIKVKLSDGIRDIDDDTDVVVIAGMGGDLISKIFLNDPLKNVRRLILQPNNYPEAIRKNMSKIGFKIIDEIVFEDQNRIYDIIVLEKGEEVLDEKQTLFGPINLQSKPHFFIKRLRKEHEYLKIVLQNVNDKSQVSELQKRCELIEEVLNES